MSDDFSETKIKRTILIAEDDDSMRRFLEVILKKLNYHIFTAKDGFEAMEIALNNDVDAVITDAIMPNMTGYDLCRILREHPQKKHIPLIILTGFDLNQDSGDINDLADFYLKKENDLSEELVKTLSKLVFV